MDFLGHPHHPLLLVQMSQSWFPAKKLTKLEEAQVNSCKTSNELEKADDNLEKHVKKISEKCSVTRQHKTDLKKGTKVQYQEDLVKCDKVAADHDITNKNNNNPRKLSIEDSKLLCRTCLGAV